MTEEIHDFPDRASADAFLADRGHSEKSIRNGWRSPDSANLPDDLALPTASIGKGATRCTVKPLNCGDGTRGFLTFCYTELGDGKAEVFWSNTCTGESGSN